MSRKFSSEPSRSISAWGWSSAVEHSPAALRRPQRCGSSCRHSHQVPDAHQVVCRHHDGEVPAPSLHRAELVLPQQSHRLQPAQDPFGPFAYLLTSDVARMAGGLTVNATCPSRRMLRHMRTHQLISQRPHERGLIIASIGSQRDASCGTLGMGIH